MAYLDNDTKMVLVLNGKVAVPQLFNAAGHAIAGLVGTMDPAALALETYVNEPSAFRATISRHPVIVLKARNSNQLATLLAAANDAGHCANGFVSTMIGASSADQLQRTAAARPEDLEFWGVVLFGAAADLQPLTRKFSVFTHDVGGHDAAR